MTLYPPELEVKEATATTSSASFLDIYPEFDDSGEFSTKIYDKPDDEIKGSSLINLLFFYKVLKKFN
jgi:hypothetical protein